jgi:rhamnulokinase
MLAQYMAAGRIGSLTEGRAVVRASCPVQTFEPREGAAWDEAFQRFLTVAAG